MSIVVLTLGFLCILGCVVLGFLSAPDSLSLFGKFIWLRENARGQENRRFRFALLISGFLLLLSSVFVDRVARNSHDILGWARSELESFTAFDVTFAIIIGAASVGVVLFGTLAERWSELEGRAKAVAIAATVLKFAILAPLLSVALVPVLILVQKSDR